MLSSCAHLYLHLVWATWDRQPFIREDLWAPLYLAIAAASEELRCQVIEIGGVADHVHLLVRLPATLSVADLAHKVKESSSRKARCIRCGSATRSKICYDGPAGKRLASTDSEALELLQYPAG